MSERDGDELQETQAEPQTDGEDAETDAAGRNEVDEASEESFPASDPPSY